MRPVVPMFAATTPRDTVSNMAEPAGTTAKRRRPPTAQAWVLDELRRRIVNSDLRPGDQILADAVAEELGVSRVPVREALRILEGEGQVEHRPHRGYFVTELRLTDLEELYRIRHLLEADALKLTVPALEKQDFDEMAAALKELEKAHARGDIGAHVTANRRFHWAFLRPLELPRLRRLIQVHYDSCDAYGALYYNVPTNRERSRTEHLRLRAAAEDHDPKRVIKVLEAHRANVIEALRGVLETDPVAENDAGA